MRSGSSSHYPTSQILSFSINITGVSFGQQEMGSIEWVTRGDLLLSKLTTFFRDYTENSGTENLLTSYHCQLVFVEDYFVFVPFLCYVALCSSLT
jgi:hypothetical protein